MWQYYRDDYWGIQKIFQSKVIVRKETISNNNIDMMTNQYLFISLKILSIMTYEFLYMYINIICFYLYPNPKFLNAKCCLNTSSCTRTLPKLS